MGISFLDQFYNLVFGACNFSHLQQRRRAMATTKETIGALEKQLLNATGGIPLHSRFRALFTLKSLKSEAAIAAIAKG